MGCCALESRTCPTSVRHVVAAKESKSPLADEDISVSAAAWYISGCILGEILRHKVIDRLESISILRNGPSAPNGGRSSVRMGVELDDIHTAAGHPSG